MGSKKSSSSSSSSRRSSSSSSNRGGYHPDLRAQERRNAKDYGKTLGSRWKRLGKTDLTGRPW